LLASFTKFKGENKIHLTENNKYR